MAQSRTRTFELRRADGGPDLWVAVEAAQYARVVDHVAPRTDAEAARMQDLIGFFLECSEAWDGKTAADQTLALERLGTRLAALAELQLFVYWAVVQGKCRTAQGKPVELPMAILTIARDGRPTISVRLPDVLGID